MRATTKIQISNEADRLLDKIAKKGGYRSKSTVLEVIIREAAHARDLILEYEESQFLELDFPAQSIATDSANLEALRATLSNSLRLQIRDLNAQPNPRGRHLHQLQSGNDAFSKLKLPELQALAGPEAISEIEAAFPEMPQHQEAILRWVLRGLSLHHSIAKRLYYLKKFNSPAISPKIIKPAAKALQFALSNELQQQIESLNQKAQPTDSELNVLQVGGSDVVSRLSAEEVLSYANEDALAQVQAAFPEAPQYQLDALRWVLRGLLPRFAIRKIKVRLYKFAHV